MNYLDGMDIELADVQIVRDALERKYNLLMEIEPYAKTELYELEKALYVIWDLESDVANRL